MEPPGTPETPRSSPEGEGAPPAPPPGRVRSSRERHHARIETIRSRGREFSRGEWPLLSLLAFALLLMLFMITVGPWGPKRSKKPAEETFTGPIPWAEIVRGKVTELEGGRVEVLYRFAQVPGASSLEAAYPDLRDWRSSVTADEPDLVRMADQVGIVSPTEVALSFTGDLVLEFDFRILEGHQVTPQFAVTDRSSLRWELAGGGRTALFTVIQPSDPEAPPRVTRLGEDARFESFRLREPHRARLVLADRTLTGELDGKPVVRASLPPEFPAEGWIRLEAYESKAVFTNIRLIGTLHPRWLKERLWRWKRFEQQAKKGP